MIFIYIEISARLCLIAYYDCGSSMLNWQTLYLYCSDFIPWIYALLLLSLLFAFQISFVLYNTSLLQRLSFRKDGVLFKDVSTCCDGLLSTQRLFLLKTNCENSLLVNQSTDVKIDSITMKIYNQFCARDLGNIEK